MAQQYGVIGSRPISENLEHFHVVDGFPPDLLHDLLEGAGCEDVAVNQGKRSTGIPEGELSSKNIKRPKRGEANCLRNLPEGHDETSLENARKVLTEEMKKKQPNGTLISQMMDQTFPLHRRAIVKKEPAVQIMVERWPALFRETGKLLFLS